MVSDLIVGVVVDVLVHIFIKVLQGLGIGHTSSTTQLRPLLVLNSSEFVVLYPEVAFDGFSRSEESKDCGVSLGELATSVGILINSGELIG